MFGRARMGGPGRATHAFLGWTALTAALLLSLVVAIPAWASSIVYLDNDDDIWMTSPDGAVKRQITTNGATLNYSSPSMTDKGVIVAGATHASFFYFNRDGSSAGGPWAALDMNCASMQQPISNQVSPNGGMNVYWYFDNGSACWNFFGPTVAFATFNGMTAKGVFATFDGAWYPRWVPGTTYAAAVQESGASIQTLNTPGGTPWIVDSDSRLRYFDISRAGNKVLVAKSDTADLHSLTDLILWQNDGTPPASGHAICATLNWGHDNQAPDISIPRWSPDGTAFTWSDAQGVWVSPAPVASGANCVIHPKLIAPGGSYPDWGLSDVLTPGLSTDQVASLLRKVGTPSGKAARIPAIVKKGYSFSFAAPAAGQLVMSWYQVPKGAHLSSARPVLVGSGKASFASASTKRITVKLTAKGHQLLRRARSIKLTAKLTFSSTGNKAVSAFRSFTLKR